VSRYNPRVVQPPLAPWRIAPWLAPIALLVLVSCAVAVSQAPLSNSEPAGSDVYFYGPHGAGGKNKSPSEEKPAPKPPTPVKLPHPPSLTSAHAVKDPPQVRVPEIELDLDGGTLPGPVDIAGRYSGTDTVTILLAGTPSEPQVDDNAKIDVKEVGEQRVAITVVDSSQGTPLCTIEGKIAGFVITFDPGQDCFTGILGIPADAHVTTGNGKLEGERLTLDFEVALEIDAPGTTLEGSVDYHFEGTKLQSP
jgi:hypothetical protein